MEVSQQIKQDEDLKLKPYKCTANKLTIGYGYNLENGIPQEIAEMLFQYSLKSATNDAVKIIVDYNLKPDWKLRDILIQMCFQMGGQGVRKFKKMLTALEKRDFETASKEMLNSKWHSDTPERCERLSAEMSRL